MTGPEVAQIIACPNCGTRNRVASEQWEKTPICGKCKTPLPLEIEPVEVTDHNFNEVIASSHLPVLLDLWAPWCGPCKMIAPTIAQLSREFAGRAVVGKLNTDLNPATASRFRISGIPTLLILRNGREVDRIVGLAPADQIRRKLETAISNG